MIEKGKSPFTAITNTILKQMLFIGAQGNNKLFKGSSAQFAKLVQRFFSNCGFNSNLGIDIKSVRAHVIYTASNDYMKQVPHTDYPLAAIRKLQNRKAWLGWTARMTLTPDGSWIHVWSGPGFSTAIKIEFGECLFLRGDVVHAGGRPKVDKVDSLYRHLHFYLPTKLQVSPINDVFLVDLDGRTSLSDMYLFTENEEKTKKRSASTHPDQRRSNRIKK